MKQRRNERFAIRLVAAEKRALAEIAQAEDVTMTHLIRRALRDVISRWSVRAR